MAKISPVSAKYIVHASIQIDGVVDRPDVIGAIFGQTEGLLGADLELRELQRSGRIGRIEVDCDTRSGKTQGSIIISSSLDKAETAIVGAALEIIQRIGPCNAKIKVEKIEDVRVSKRSAVIERAKELLKGLMDSSMPDSQELTDEVAYSVRVMEITEYGKDRLPAGPAIDDSEEVIVVEGRADFLNLLKHGFKNCIAMNGTSVPQTIIELSRKKTLTVFVDGDRGGDLIVKELLAVAEIDFVTKAPDGKEVEEITKKEIHKAIRAKVAAEQVKMDIGREPVNSLRNKPTFQRPLPQGFREQRGPPRPPMPQPRSVMSPQEKEKFKSIIEDLIGTRGACILDQKLEVLGKVPTSELQTTIKSLGAGVYAVAFDGEIDRELIDVAERTNIRFLIGMDAKSKGTGRTTVLTVAEL